MLQAALAELRRLARRHRRRRGLGLQRREVALGEREDLLGLDGTDHEHHRVVRRVELLVERLQVLHLPALDVRRPADDRDLVRVRDERGRLHLLDERAEVVVVHRRAPLRVHDAALALDHLRVEVEVAHAVGLEVEDEPGGARGEPVLVHGDVRAGVGVVASAARLHHAVELARRAILRAVEHHVLEVVRDAGDARPLVAAADAVPGVHGDVGDVVVRPDDDLEAVRQRARDDAVGARHRGRRGRGVAGRNHEQQPGRDDGHSVHGSASLLRRDPAIDLGLEHVERQRPVAEHGGVELANVEAIPERLLGACAQLADLELAELVGERLAGDGHVALGLRDAARLAGGTVRLDVVEHLLARPALGVQARVHHQADRAEQLALEAAEILVRVGIHSEVRPERLGVEAPALAVGRVAAEAAEPGQFLLLARDGDLEVVPGIALVQRQRLHRPLRPRAQVVGVGVEDAGARAVLARGLVAAAGGALLAEGLHGAHLVVRLRQHLEQLRQLRVHAFLDVPVAGHQRLARGPDEARVRVQEAEECVEVALEADALHHALHLAADARDLGEADLVDLGRRERGGGDVPDAVGVPGLAIRQRIEPDARARARQVLVAHEVVQAPVGRHDLVLDGRAVGRGEALAIGGAEALGQVADRSPEHRVLRALDDVRGELRQDALGEHPRQRVAALHPLAHVHDGLVRPGDETLEALQELVVVLHRLERLDAVAGAELGEGVGDGIELVERDEVIRVAVTLDLAFAGRLEDLVGEQVLALQTARVELTQPGEVVPLELFRARPPLGRDRDLEAVVVAGVADRGGAHRVQLQVVLEVGLDEFIEATRLGGGIGRDGVRNRGAVRRRRRGVCAGGEEQGGDRHREGSLTHR